VVGANEGGATVTDSYNTGTVSGNSDVGGVVGYNYYNSTVTASYNTGTVSGNNSVGGVVGYNVWNSTVTDSYNSGTVSGNGNVGGVVGANEKGATVTNSYNSGRVSGSDGVGGVVGANYFSAVTDSYNTGTVSGNNRVGGVVGYSYSSSLTNSYNTGSVSGNNYVGGVVGCKYDNSTVTASYNSGTVSGSYYVGGVVGYNTYGSTITNSYNSGRVSGSDGVGGVVGANEGGATVTDSYNTGTVSGNNRVGGVVGVNDSSSTVADSYNSGTVSGTYNFGGLCGSGAATNSYYLDTSVSNPSNTSGTVLTETEMKIEESFVGFDFVNVWAIESSTGYAYPQFIRNLDPALGEASAVWNGTVAEGFASGTGTESDPYLIKTAGQLAYLASSVGSGTTYQGKYLKLESDIVLNDNSVKYWTLNASDWTPIGSGNNSFRGNFDGAGHVVRGIYIDTGKNYQGLFGKVDGGTVSDVGVEESYIKGGNYVGGVVGYSYSSSVTASYNSGTCFRQLIMSAVWLDVTPATPQ
jgi:hypothetical protein